MATMRVSAAALNSVFREAIMKPLVDRWPGYDDWLTKDLPDDEPPLTEAELRQQREVEQDARLIQRLFE